MKKRAQDDRPMCCGIPMGRAGRAESGRRRYHCARCKRRTTNTDGPEAAISPGYDRDRVADYCDQVRSKIKAGASTFIVTTAVNNTRLHLDFWRTLMQIQRHRDAVMLVTPNSYKNPSLYTSNDRFEKWYTSRVEPYLVDQVINLGGGIELQGDTRIVPTAIHPLSGMQEVGGRRWQIIGHPQVALQCVAAPMNHEPKRLYTTGAVTLPNYSETKLGKRARFHHSHAALIVEVVGRRCWVRQLHWGGGAVYDLEWKYTPTGVERHGGVTSVHLFDEHEWNLDPTLRQVTFGKDGIVQSLRPKYLIRNDVLDGFAGSHHHEKDWRQLAAKFHTGRNDVRAEMESCCRHIDDTTPPGCTSLIVQDNHSSHVTKWLERVDVRHDYVNGEFASEMLAKMHQAAARGEIAEPFELFARDHLTCRHRFLRADEPFLVDGVDWSQHGHVGVNGARWSNRAAARTTFKLTKGHDHTEAIEKGVYSAGGPGRLEYQSGLSTHTQAVVAQYPNGKRAIVSVRGKRWRGRAPAEP